MYEVLLASQNPWWSVAGWVGPYRTAARRDLQPDVMRRLTSSDRRATVVLGPRQVGKTVLLRQCVDDLLTRGWAPTDILYFDFSDDRLTKVPATPHDVVASAPAFPASRRPKVLLLDEVGRCPNWGDWVKRSVDQSDFRIAVTDSSAHILRTGGRQSGVGRWDELVLEGLTYREYLALQARPGESPEALERRIPGRFESYLLFGGFPEYLQIDSLDVVRERLREDIADKAILRDLGSNSVDVTRIKSLFLYLLEDSGAIFDPVSRNRLLASYGDDVPDKRTVEKWLELLLDTMLISRVDPFAKAPTGRLGGRNRPKLYAADQGLIVAFSTSTDPALDPKLRGQIVEAAVFRALRSVGADRVEYVRDRREADFVVQHGKERTVIEVTASHSPRDKLAPVRGWMGEVKASRALVVHGGTEHNELGTATLRAFLLDPKGCLERRPA